MSGAGSDASFIMAAWILHDLVDEELWIPLDIEASVHYLDGEAQAIDQGFILSHVVVCGEVEPYDVAQMYFEG
jgi:hypothetical protein